MELSFLPLTFRAFWLSSRNRLEWNMKWRRVRFSNYRESFWDSRLNKNRKTKFTFAESMRFILILSQETKLAFCFIFIYLRISESRGKEKDGSLNRDILLKIESDHELLESSISHFITILIFSTLIFTSPVVSRVSDSRLEDEKKPKEIDFTRNR